MSCFLKETTNDGLLAAIDSGSIDNALKGGKLINDHGVISDSDKEVIRLINDKAAQILKFASDETAKLHMVNEIIHSGMWTMFFDPVSGDINRVDWSDSLHPEDKQAALDAFNKHVSDYSGRTPFDIEYRLRRKDGSYRWFKAIGTTIRESDGTPIVVAGSILDITDSKKNKQIEVELKK